jgi:hypothetical protein
MATENKYNITLAPGMEKAELVIRTLSTPNEIAVQPPVPIHISGTIDSVTRFLATRKINTEKAHILVNREKLTITLIINEDDAFLRGGISGKIEVHPAFESFGINTGKVWTPSKLGLFCKMNRAFFVDKSENMKIVKELTNFTAKVNSSLDRSVSESGDKTDNFQQIVESNIPAVFKLKIPVVKGAQADLLEVETFADINGRDVSFTLISPEANQVIEDMRNKLIDQELAKIDKMGLGITTIEV